MFEDEVYFTEDFLCRRARNYLFLLECIKGGSLNMNKDLKWNFNNIYFSDDEDLDKNALDILANMQFKEIRQFIGYRKGNKKEWIWAITLENPNKVADRGFLLLSGGNFRGGWNTYLVGAFYSTADLYNEWHRISSDILGRKFVLSFNIVNVALKPRKNPGFIAKRKLKNHFVRDDGPLQGEMEKEEYNAIPFYEEEKYFQELDRKEKSKRKKNNKLKGQGDLF